jgi:hypothetical protein
MSKKMMKRSLALGALMAFVITGSALAAELNKKDIIEGPPEGASGYLADAAVGSAPSNV